MPSTRECAGRGGGQPHRYRRCDGRARNSKVSQRSGPGECFQDREHSSKVRHQKGEEGQDFVKRRAASTKRNSEFLKKRNENEVEQRETTYTFVTKTSSPTENRVDGRSSILGRGPGVELTLVLQAIENERHALLTNPKKKAATSSPEKDRYDKKRVAAKQKRRELKLLNLVCRSVLLHQELTRSISVQTRAHGQSSI